MISSLPGPLLTMVIGKSNLLLNEFHILSAVLRQFIEVADTADIALPARELFQYGLCLFQLVGNREISGNFSVDLITNTYRNLIQISKYIEYCKCYIGSALQATAVLGSYTVEPSHTSRAACGCTELSAVSSAVTQFICLVTEDLRYESTCSYGRGICLTYGNDLLDLIRRDTLHRWRRKLPGWRKKLPWVDSVVRILHGT